MLARRRAGLCRLLFLLRRISRLQVFLFLFFFPFNDVILPDFITLAPSEMSLAQEALLLGQAALDCTPKQLDAIQLLLARVPVTRRNQSPVVVLCTALVLQQPELSPEQYQLVIDNLFCQQK